MVGPWELASSTGSETHGVDQEMVKFNEAGWKNRYSPTDVVCFDATLFQLHIFFNFGVFGSDLGTKPLSRDAPNAAPVFFGIDIVHGRVRSAPRHLTCNTCRLFRGSPLKTLELL